MIVASYLVRMEPVTQHFFPAGMFELSQCPLCNEKRIVLMVHTMFASLYQCTCSFLVPQGI